jgi:hypothetical protein
MWGWRENDMVKKESEKSYPERSPGGQADETSSDGIEDRIKIIIGKMPMIDFPKGLLPAVMEAVRAKSVRLVSGTSRQDFH